MGAGRPETIVVFQGGQLLIFRQSPALCCGRDDGRDLMAGILDCEVGFPIGLIVFIVIRFNYRG